MLSLVNGGLFQYSTSLGSFVQLLVKWLFSIIKLNSLDPTPRFLVLSISGLSDQTRRVSMNSDPSNAEVPA